MVALLLAMKPRVNAAGRERGDQMKPLYFEFESEFPGLFQGICWAPPDRPFEPEGVYLDIDKRLPWSAEELRGLIQKLTEVVGALEAGTPEQREDRLIREAGFKPGPAARSRPVHRASPGLQLAR